ncbi:Peptidase [Phytophthora megakarya]|uniref:Peptidase n=1 Tax=Phytophthora megakarya TaxID=4795 RepID=A0A225V1Y8_9STRA|nr:Peptidase [Phytophthora megakarya]
MAAVTLHVYDLSHGYAQRWTQPLPTKTIDGVWHTGVLVFGMEYFFCTSGIHAMEPQLVVERYGMEPVRTIKLGETSRSRKEFDQFLLDIRAQFNSTTYHLLDHNCNHFSDTAAKYLIGSSIPQYILDLPDEVRNSPVGYVRLPILASLAPLKSIKVTEEMEVKTGLSNQMHAAKSDQCFVKPAATAIASKESYFSTTMVILAGLLGIFIGGKIYDRATTKKHGYRRQL